MITKDTIEEIQDHAEQDLHDFKNMKIIFVLEDGRTFTTDDIFGVFTDDDTVFISYEDGNATRDIYLAYEHIVSVEYYKEKK